LKLSDVLILIIGTRARSDDVTIVQIALATTAVSVTPTTVKPYAHSTRAQGHFSGLRQSRPNDSLSSFRKSSVIGLGSTALHSSQSSQTATPISITPHNAVNAASSAPPR
jgi:hypothetical protein